MNEVYSSNHVTCHTDYLDNTISRLSRYFVGDILNSANMSWKDKETKSSSTLAPKAKVGLNSQLKGFCDHGLCRIQVQSYLSFYLVGLCGRKVAYELTESSLMYNFFFKKKQGLYA